MSDLLVLYFREPSRGGRNEGRAGVVSKSPGLRKRRRRQGDRSGADRKRCRKTNRAGAAGLSFAEGSSGQAKCRGYIEGTGKGFASRSRGIRCLHARESKGGAVRALARDFVCFLCFQRIFFRVHKATRRNMLHGVSCSRTLFFFSNQSALSVCPSSGLCGGGFFFLSWFGPRNTRQGVRRDFFRLDSVSRVAGCGARAEQPMDPRQ